MPHPALAELTERIARRSAATRAAYEAAMARQASAGRSRVALSCANRAHGLAAAGRSDKAALAGSSSRNYAIVTAYNDVLSAHQPYADYPERLKRAARALHATAQVAGGVPAMCDGVTQGRPGMELSLFSRDVIALATVIALSHALFDGVLHLGICDKIVPGLFIGGASFGHLPQLFVPAGPMPPGLPSRDKVRAREAYARGESDDAALFAAECASYHAPGTCTFYGTANSNQLILELMGLTLPGAAFVNPGTPLREALSEEAVRVLHEKTPPFARIATAETLVNGLVALLASGGSTNHSLHLVAMARAVGVVLDWQDFADAAAFTPLLARIYPNGEADINAFREAGGTPFLARELLAAGLLHEGVATALGPGTLDRYARVPALTLRDNLAGPALAQLEWREPPAASADPGVLRPCGSPFQPASGLRLLTGPLGRAVLKTSAVAPERWAVTAPARIFDSQEAVQSAFKAGELDRDVVVVVRFQGPRANGMPELHELMPPLAVLQERGHRVALVTDGRLSGASGKVPAAIHLTPEAYGGGPLARLKDGDVVSVDGVAGVLGLDFSEAELIARPPAPDPAPAEGCGRELFAPLRAAVSGAEQGGHIFGWAFPEREG